jgi:arsenite-transporting ATPase
MMRLQDPAQTKILLVTLPETTPVLEAEHLQNDLRRAGIEPWAWIVNSSLAAARTRQPLLQKRARSEWEQIDRVRDTLCRRFAVVAMQAAEPVGIDRLKSLCENADNSVAA